MADKDLDQAAQLIEAIDRRRRTRRLDYYEPYEFQKKFHHAIGFETNEIANQRFLMAANKVGKTISGGIETAMHLTGLYPKWWRGFRFKQPIIALCGSNTNEQTRDLVQTELCGDPSDDNAFGTGAIPKDCIVDFVRKAGVPNGFDSVSVKHTSGGLSKVMFRGYEQGAKKHMGSRIHWGWCDEEPPLDVWSQYLRGTFSTGGLLIMTFTPEEGITDVVHRVLNGLVKGQALITATWDDAPHMTPERQELLLGQIPEHEREMRSRGIPIMGSGLVFSVLDEDLLIDPIPLPRHWPRIIGLDFGWDHPITADSERYSNGKAGDAEGHGAHRGPRPRPPLRAPDEQLEEEARAPVVRGRQAA
jgi:phage terminase large subunit-like protein